MFVHCLECLGVYLHSVALAELLYESLLAVALVVAYKLVAHVSPLLGPFLSTFPTTAT